ncbi:hypothetical protein LVD15_07065 [Fulvivirga maritima]|uniref:hypothetical protein n=1 Tax=Fulvivirga maritima TaxID=2904247 RepID=UPI001F25F764|nr:hypothetical protein [Fulvivirga maritima]UII28178.1 hypothetical protein LVD15_07065 [Fulvivirga maritima]
MQKIIIFSLAVALGSFIPTLAQQTSDLRYQSSFEKEFIESYLKSKSDNALNLLLAPDEGMTTDFAAETDKNLTDFLSRYDQKITADKISGRHLSQLFYKVHRKFLKRYVQYTTLGQTLRSGNYDCLSGTAFYAVILNRLEVPFEIIETNYHIYLQIETDQGVALMESTDPLYGYITNPKEIKERLKDFEKAGTRKVDPAQHEFNYSINQATSISGLAGLQYFNLAVNAFNEQKFEKSLNQLEKANLFYNSERIIEFGALVGTQILESGQYSTSDKDIMIARIQRLINSDLTVASR